MIRLTPLVICLFTALAVAQGFNTEAMESFAAQLFDRMDRNQDGLLSEQEHVAAKGGGFNVDYRLLDLDGNGSVSKSEYLMAVRKYHPPHPRGEQI